MSLSKKKRNEEREINLETRKKREDKRNLSTNHMEKNDLELEDDNENTEDIDIHLNEAAAIATDVVFLNNGDEIFKKQANIIK